MDHTADCNATGHNAISQIFRVIVEQSQATFDEDFNLVSYYNWTGGNGALSPAVNNAGNGEPKAFTGLVGTHHRPSDDLSVFAFLTPANAMLSVELTNLADILDSAKQARNVSVLAREYSARIENAIWNSTIIDNIFAYETNGFGGRYVMDDANVPSLLALPYLGFLDKTNPAYVATRKVLLSRQNPYYAEGKTFKGIGGPHVDAWNPWPMSQISAIFGTDDDEEITNALYLIANRNLPNKRHIGKQDPYCSLEWNGEKRRSKAIKRGGQHPEWDEEIRFTVCEGDRAESPLVGSDGTAPRPPPKTDSLKDKLNVQGGKYMIVACYAEDVREPDFIGETKVDLTEVLTKGETDQWYTLMNKGKYCGEVFLELTFWSNEPPPVRNPSTTSRGREHYGGPGTFVPSEPAPSSAAPVASSSSHTSDSRNGSFSEHSVSSSNVSEQGGRNSIPPSLRASSSIPGRDLYTAPYETSRSRQSFNSIESMTDDFAELGVNGHLNRQTPHPPATNYTYPPPSSSHYQHHSSLSYDNLGSQTAHHEYEQPSSYSDDGGSYQYDRPNVPNELHLSQHVPPPAQPVVYQGPYESLAPAPTVKSVTARGRGPRYSMPTSSSGFIPIGSSVPTPGSTAMHQQPAYPVPSSTPAPSPYGALVSQIARPPTGAPSYMSAPLSHTPAPAPISSYSSVSQQYYTASTFVPSSASYPAISQSLSANHYDQYAQPPVPAQQYATQPSVHSYAPLNGPSHRSYQIQHSLPLPPPPVPSYVPAAQSTYAETGYASKSPSTQPYIPPPPPLNHSNSSPVQSQGSRPLPQPGATRLRRHSIVSNSSYQPGQPAYAAYSQIPPPPMLPGQSGESVVTAQTRDLPEPSSAFPNSGQGSPHTSYPSGQGSPHTSYPSGQGSPHTLDPSGQEQEQYIQGPPPSLALPPPPPAQHIVSRRMSISGYPLEQRQTMYQSIPPPPGLQQEYQYENTPSVFPTSQSAYPGPLPRPPQYLPPSQSAQGYPVSSGVWQ
ncbi:hypothetical protein PHLCEN_2v10536 [Hermanssonia centrifuga]|uniref:C2 domain-containing protein n=1 Tax=Hermanssonia centrifuga TaxID=98765 RepID=A0A2R6NMJ9_9APHY|nr:hypothetical protein PHLCEN_2v10536 [Hermanssonia centrifuga]